MCVVTGKHLICNFFPITCYCNYSTPVCMCKKCFDSYHEISFYFIDAHSSASNTLSNDDSEDLQKPYKSKDEVAVDGDYFY